jgi:DUF3048 family protein
LALTRRGRAVASIGGALALVGVGGIALALTGHAPALLQRAVDGFTGVEHTKPPPTCPLTGMPAPDDEVPHRPVVAVKVENTTEAYPLAGLQNADVVYEELVEGGITRFMSLYQCKSSLRVGPVRSARMTDPRVVLQFGPRSMLSYSGGQQAVVNDIGRSTLMSFDETSGGDAFSRDDSRVMPHNLFLNTAKLWARAGSAARNAGPPRRVFTFDGDVPRSGKRVSGVALTFSYANTAAWQWMPARGEWQRLLDGSPMTLESGEPITAENVVIQQVVVSASNLVDVLGNPSPEITLTGSGKVWVLRDGRLIAGRWVRPVMGAVTKFEMTDGTIIALSPGNTWVELLPKGTAPDFHR